MSCAVEKRDKGVSINSANILLFINSLHEALNSKRLNKSKLRAEVSPIKTTVRVRVNTKYFSVKTSE